MNRILKLFDRLIPPYARLCALALIAMDIFVYYLPKALDVHRTLHPISTVLDVRFGYI